MQEKGDIPSTKEQCLTIMSHSPEESSFTSKLKPKSRSWKEEGKKIERKRKKKKKKRKKKKRRKKKKKKKKKKRKKKVIKEK